MGLILNRRRYMGGEILPYDARLEYLESDGTAWINTGLSTSGSVGYAVEMRYCFATTPSGESWMFGNWDGKCLLIGYYGGNYRIDFGPDNSTYYGNLAIDNKFHTVRLDSSGAYIDGERKASTDLNNTSACTNIPIFKSYHVNSSCRKQLSYCKIWTVSGTLVRDFIPVRVGQVGYLYDKVSRQLFGNAGSGSFTLGSDK